MPILRRRALLASLLDTAPAMRSRIVASASMKQLTVEPLPTPITAPGTTYASAACPTITFSSSCVIADPASGGAIVGDARAPTQRRPTICSGRTQASKSAALTQPDASAASFSVLPLWWARFAICAALS